MKKIIMSFSLVLIAAGFASAESPNMQPGKWEVTMSMEMPGMPFSMPPMKYTQCITKKDLEDPKKTTPSQEQKDCEMKDYKVSGNTATWRVVCTGKNPSSATGEVTYHGSSYEGKLVTETADPKGAKAKMTTKFSGKRIGDCQ